MGWDGMVGVVVVGGLGGRKRVWMRSDGAVGDSGLGGVFRSGPGYKIKQRGISFPI